MTVLFKTSQLKGESVFWVVSVYYEEHILKDTQKQSKASISGMILYSFTGTRIPLFLSRKYQNFIISGRECSHQEQRTTVCLRHW